MVESQRRQLASKACSFEKVADTSIESQIDHQELTDKPDSILSDTNEQVLILLLAYNYITKKSFDILYEADRGKRHSESAPFIFTIENSETDRNGHSRRTISYPSGEFGKQTLRRMEATCFGDFMHVFSCCVNFRTF